MQLLPTLVASALAIAAVQATSSDFQAGTRRDHAISKERRRAIVEEYLEAHPQEKRAKKSCKNKGKKSSTKSSSKASKSHSKEHEHKKADHKKEHDHKKADHKKEHDHKKADHKKEDHKKPVHAKVDSKKSSSDHHSSSGVFGKGLFGMKFASSCHPDASSKNPNGAQSFLNCGVDGSGWNPPKVQFSDLKMLSADDAAKNENFKACSQYAWAFKDAEKNHNIPAVVLMSFAMQESSCNPKTTGGNGEQGMMQITPDKCGGAPNGNCKDVWFNVDAGAKYFASQLKDNDNNVLAAIGSYNGWQKGMTVGSATAAAKNGQCHAQNNLDYIYQMLNGWFIGASSPYSMGKYQNLANCN